MAGCLRGLRLAAHLLRARSGAGVALGARRASTEAHGSFPYRQFPELTRSQVIKAEFISSAMWFWILWHFWHNPDAVLGHFPYPDPSQWTDEELGIPPDDE
ncbi:NADH dehydrogenase [ubiquinone] 1 beta subcomplex subunit 2, mitochondrial [Heteronotia binoei]|uniref:NADH dehydrogenase [ubiquinone] 1 beta subcomplex subunit 2, mitochondrial n=1 Tax=Heteronotia binoei TaxID=13085 RepID=UPI0029309389|nr:NADH dehydrogenase [ubiquinone] 1 beta subcomplex subunit 2, mitochondrial [Heteronotia binoei]